MAEPGHRADVAIIGGGPAGAAAALALRRRGVDRVIIAEAGRFDEPRVGESIPPDTRRLLEALGAWESFAASGHDPCLGSCSSWGGTSLGYNDFLFNPHGPGFHLDRRRFDHALAQAAEEAGAEVWLGARLDSLHRRGDGVLLRLERGGHDEWIEARFVVDATGRPARVARRLGARRLLHDRLTLLYGFFPPGSGASATSLTLLEAVPYGWWYAARLPDGRLVIAVASDPEILRTEELHRPEVFRARLAETQHIGALLAATATLDRPLIACDAPSACLDRVAGRDWLAVGDAASTFDPLSAQGIHKALADGLHAGQAIATRLDSGSANGLGEYAAAVGQRFNEYLRQRAYLYGMEARWAEAPFWARRRARNEPSGV